VEPAESSNSIRRFHTALKRAVARFAGIRHTRLLLSLLAAATLVLQRVELTGAQALVTATVEFKLPAGSFPIGIVAGLHEDVWFTECRRSAIGHLSSSGSFREYRLPAASGCPTQIAADGKGTFWFTDDGGEKESRIGCILESGKITEYDIPNAAAHPVGITVARNGDIWFTEADGLAQFSRSRGFHEWAIPSSSLVATGQLEALGVRGIAQSSDGAIWFTESVDNHIGYFDGSAFKRFPLANKFGSPAGIISSRDGSIWFANEHALAHVHANGKTFEELFPNTIPAIGQPDGIALGKDGELWVAQSNYVAKRAKSGRILELPLSSVPGFSPGVRGIAVSTDGKVWLTESFSGAIARLR
jgi:streptogramin lyase